MSNTIITEHDAHTLNALQRMADSGNCTKEAIVEGAVRQSIDAYEQLERDIQEARDDVKAGRCYTQEQAIEMLSRLDVDVS
jgi:predicted transcriptional regulator